MSPQEFINHLTIYKTPWDKFSEIDKKTYLPYIMNVWLAQVPDLIEIVNESQKQQIPNRDHYNFWLQVLPKKRLNSRWIKAKKKQYSKDVVNHIAAFYNVGSSEIYDSISILDEQQIKNILSEMGISDKEQIKLLK